MKLYLLIMTFSLISFNVFANPFCNDASITNYRPNFSEFGSNIINDIQGKRSGRSLECFSKLKEFKDHFINYSFGDDISSTATEITKLSLAVKNIKNIKWNEVKEADEIKKNWLYLSIYQKLLYPSVDDFFSKGEELDVFSDFTIMSDNAFKIKLLKNLLKAGKNEDDSYDSLISTFEFLKQKFPDFLKTNIKVQEIAPDLSLDIIHYFNLNVESEYSINFLLPLVFLNKTKISNAESIISNTRNENNRCNEYTEEEETRILNTLNVYREKLNNIAKIFNITIEEEDLALRDAKLFYFIPFYYYFKLPLSAYESSDNLANLSNKQLESLFISLQKVSQSSVVDNKYTCMSYYLGTEPMDAFISSLPQTIIGKLSLEKNNLCLRSYLNNTNDFWKNSFVSWSKKSLLKCLGEENIKRINIEINIDKLYSDLYANIFDYGGHATELDEIKKLNFPNEKYLMFLVEATDDRGDELVNSIKEYLYSGKDGLSLGKTFLEALTILSDEEFIYLTEKRFKGSKDGLIENIFRERSPYSLDLVKQKEVFQIIDKIFLKRIFLNDTKAYNESLEKILDKKVDNWGELIDSTNPQYQNIEESILSLMDRDYLINSAKPETFFKAVKHSIFDDQSLDMMFEISNYGKKYKISKSLLSLENYKLLKDHEQKLDFTNKDVLSQTLKSLIFSFYVQGEYSEDFEGIFSYIDESLSSYNATDFFSAKNNIYKILNSLSELPIVYNKDYFNPIDPFKKGKLQCYSGTFSYLFYFLSQMAAGNSSSVFKLNNLVFIFEKGHVLPGYVEKTDQGYILTGIEMTVSGRGEKAYGLIQNAKTDIVVIAAKDIILNEIFTDSIVEKNEFESDIYKQNQDKFGFKDPIQTSVGNGGIADSKLNTNPFGFGEVIVAPDDKDINNADILPVTSENSLSASDLVVPLGEFKDKIRKEFIDLSKNIITTEIYDRAADISHQTIDDLYAGTNIDEFKRLIEQIELRKIELLTSKPNNISKDEHLLSDQEYRSLIIYFHQNFSLLLPRLYNANFLSKVNDYKPELNFEDLTQYISEDVFWVGDGYFYADVEIKSFSLAQRLGMPLKAYYSVVLDFGNRNSLSLNFSFYANSDFKEKVIETGEFKSGIKTCISENFSKEDVDSALIYNSSLDNFRDKQINFLKCFEDSLSDDNIKVRRHQTNRSYYDDKMLINNSTQFDVGEYNERPFNMDLFDE